MGSKCNLVTAMWWGTVPSVIIRNDNKRISTNAEEASWFSYREPSKFLHWALKRKQLPSGEDCYVLRRKCPLSRNSHFILLISSTNGNCTPAPLRLQLTIEKWNNLEPTPTVQTHTNYYSIAKVPGQLWGSYSYNDNQSTTQKGSLINMESVKRLIPHQDTTSKTPQQETTVPVPLKSRFAHSIQNQISKVY